MNTSPKNQVESIEYKINNSIEYKYTHSSAPGGQNVNKRNTKVQLFFDIEKSSFTDWEKEKLYRGFNVKYQGKVVLISDNTRSQEKNKQEVYVSLVKRIKDILKSHKKRIETKPTKLSQIKRLEEKKYQSRKKESRKQYTDTRYQCDWKN